jgi:hypothetical protein
VKNLFAFGLGESAAAAILVLGLAAQAQEKKEPAKKPPACTLVKTQVACEARTDCNWVTEVKKDGKTTRKAYCRAKPKK